MFRQVDAFVSSIVARYGLHMLSYANIGFAAGLQKCIAEHGAQAFVLGTRETDPNSGSQGTFAPSSEWMPPFMRVNPVLRWRCGRAAARERRGTRSEPRREGLGQHPAGKQREGRAVRDAAVEGSSREGRGREGRGREESNGGKQQERKQQGPAELHVTAPQVRRRVGLLARVRAALLLAV